VATKYPEAKLIGRRPSDNTDTKLYDTIQQEIYQASKEANTASEKPIKDIIEFNGFKVFACADSAPIVSAELSKELILQLNENPEIDTIYLETNHFSLPLSEAAPTIKAPLIWQSGYTGQGIVIAEMENQAIDFLHPALINRFGGWYNPPWDEYGEDNPLYYTYDPAEAADYGHATLCAGVIASEDSTNKGIAYGATLLSANIGKNISRDAYSVSAIDWAIGEGADIILPELSTNATGTPEIPFIARYFDHIALDHYKTIVIPAGNISQISETVSGLALGYNIISVGNFNDHGNSSWNDDTMSSDSCYENWDGREKPEVAAPGTGITTTSARGQSFHTTSGRNWSERLLWLPLIIT
jgi:hypothetical protein